MSDITKYYEDYYRKGGEYSMETHGKTDRVLTICDWLKEYVKEGGRILDVGCGDMMLSQKLPQFKWVGIDINVDKAKGEAIKHNLEETPYPFQEESFDAVVCSEVLEHLWDMRKVHREAKRLLKPSGIYVISTPNFDWIDNKLEGYVRLLYNPMQPWTVEHIRQYTPALHEKLLIDAEFKILDITGADAGYSPFLQRVRSTLKAVMVHKHGLTEYEDDSKIDQIIGRGLPLNSHTICFVSKKWGVNG